MFLTNPVGEFFSDFFQNTGIYQFFTGSWQNLIMILIALLLLFLAIFKKAEPYLLIPISVGMLLANLPGSDIFIKHNDGTYEGLLGILYMGVKYDIYPCLIFLGIGATTDFGPLISRPSTMILGAAAQIGIFLTFLLAMSIPYPTMMEGALVWQNFTAQEAASIGIIGGADGPTAVLTTKT